MTRETHQTEIAIHLQQLTKQRDDFQLGPVDMSLEDGAVYALVGANGSGKSTLLKLCLNIIQPSSGQRNIYGLQYEQSEQRIKEQMAYVPDPFEGAEFFTITEMRTLIHNWYPSWDNHLFEQLAREFNLPVHRPFGKLSQGMRKKAALTLAFSSQAPLLLLDEPFNGLDFNSQRVLRETMTAHMETIEGTVVMTTHTADDIHRIADYILVLKNGVVVGPFEKDELQTNWRRLWIKNEPSIPWPDIRGIFKTMGSPLPHILTRYADSTIHDLKRAGCDIIDEQPLPLEDILHFMMSDTEATADE